MNKVAIIQARTASTRLPRKCLLRVCNKTILEHIVLRLKHANCIDTICIATTTNAEDDIIEDTVQGMEVAIYRGSESDVLDRFYQAAKMTKADIICRVTADDPFKDPEIVDNFMGDFLKGGYDYLSNTIKPTYPEGIDIEIFHFNALEKAWKEATLPSEHEHVTPYIWKRPDIFRLYNEVYEEDLSDMRWTLDKAEDWVFVQQIYEYLYKEKGLFLMKDILELLKKHPELTKINRNTVRNEGYLKSIKEESM
ncbi:MAG: NTP transferase domain-containing protein [Lachnospiraceae bacterium]|nr:NTP transferase domain-containing protein [Lachnospiraceae bacterium]